MRFLAAIYLCFSLIVGLANGALAQTYPDFTSTTVNDFANILPQDAETRVSKTLADLKTSNGVEITLVTLPAFAPYLGDLSLKDYATNLFNTWGVGDATRNDGILVLVFPTEREMRITLGSGYGLEWDRAADEAIERGFIPSFRDGDYVGGIETGVQHTIDRVALPFKNGESAPAKPFDWLMGALFALVAGIIALPMVQKMLLWWRSKHRKCPSCFTKGSLQETKHLEREATDELGGLGQRITHCHSCSYRETEPYTTMPLGSSSDSRSGRRFSGGGGGFGGGSSSGGGSSGKW